MKIKKIIYLFLFFTLIVLTTSSFASEEITKHTIEITVPANEDIIMPYMWDSGSYWPITGTSTTPKFTVDSTNFAFETNATDTNGNACSATYSTALVLSTTNGAMASTTHTANGTTKKVDWLNVSNGSSYYFRLINHSSTPLAVYLTYYSW